MRNDVVHAKGTTTIMGSANFLLNYEEALNSVSRPLVAQNDDKGKERVNEGAVSKTYHVWSTSSGQETSGLIAAPCRLD
jgi:hypothetical protein